MKTLPAVVDKIEKVPGNLRDFYDLDDAGQWRLQVQAAGGLELGDVAGAKAEADRLFDALAGRIRQTVIGDALKRAGGDRLLLEPHLTAHVHVDRQTLVARVMGRDGKFASFDAILADLKARPGFAAAFDDPVASDNAPARPGNFTEMMRAEKARREVGAQKAALATPKPVLDPRSVGYNISTAAAWAKDNPERKAEWLAAIAGR